MNFKKFRRKYRKKIKKYKENRENRGKIKKEIKIKRKQKINKIKDKFKKFFENNKKKVIEVRDFFSFIFFYGILINYMLWGIWNVEFSIFRFLSYGILIYFIREEFVMFIRRIIARR